MQFLRYNGTERKDGLCLVSDVVRGIQTRRAGAWRRESFVRFHWPVQFNSNLLCYVLFQCLLFN